LKITTHEVMPVYFSFPKIALMRKGKRVNYKQESLLKIQKKETQKTIFLVT
jgi:hypothetical protein